MTTYVRPVKVCYSFKKFEPASKRANFLMFGLSGSGKSSVINTLYCVGGTPEEEAPVRKGSIGQCTLDFRRYIFRSDEYKVNFYDTWGWSGKIGTGEGEGHYTLKEFETILSGLLSNNHNIKKKIYASQIQEDEQIIDGVIFVLESSALENTRVLRGMKAYYDIAKRKRLSTFFAVTKIDLWAKLVLKKNILESRNPQRTLQKIQTHKAWEKIQEKVHTEIDENAKVIPMVNYDQNAIKAKNEVINRFSMEFTKIVTQVYESQNRDQDIVPPTPTTDLFNQFTRGGKTGFNPFEKLFPGGWTNAFDAVEMQPMEKLFFERERNEFVKVNYKGVVDRVTNYPIFQDFKAVSDFVLYDVFFKVLMLGRNPWRLFGIDMKVTHEKGYVLVGLYNPAMNVYFEGLVPKNFADLKHLRISFSNKTQPRRVQHYCFLDQNGAYPSVNFQPHGNNNTKYCRITLTSKNKVCLKLQLVDWTSFHTSMMNLVQEKVARHVTERELNAKIIALKEQNRKAEEGLKSAIAKLNQNISRIENSFNQGGFQQQQQGGFMPAAGGFQQNQNAQLEVIGGGFQQPQNTGLDNSLISVGNQQQGGIGFTTGN